MNNVDRLAKDIAQLSIEELVVKYQGQISTGILISDIVDAIQNSGLLESLIRKDWKNDGQDKDGLYLIQVNGKYEVFTGERGIKHWRQEFEDLKPAASSYIDGLFNELYYNAPDSKIR